MRALVVVIVMAGCSTPELGNGQWATNGGGGGWDYNTDRWNRTGEQVPFGRVEPNTIARAQHVLWSQVAATPPCVGATAGVDAVALRGSHLDGGAPIGPDVVVTRGSDSAPLAIGDSVAIAVGVRTEAEAPVDARSGAVVLTRVADFRRPPREGETPTRYRWPQYGAVYYPADDCADPSELGVVIVSPAPRFPDGRRGYLLDTVPGVFELAMTYHEGQDASLLAKAAFNLDLALALPGEQAPWSGPCGTTDVVDNRLAFLAAFAIGNISLVSLDGGGRGEVATGGTTTAGPLSGWFLALTTRRGQPIHVAALVQHGGIGRAICYRADTAPEAGEPGANPRLVWPADDATELDAVVADGLTLASLDQAADLRGFRLASGRSTRRLDAFLESSPLENRAQIAALVTAHATATRLGPYAGALASWGTVRAAVAGKAATVVAIETLADAEASYDAPVEHAVRSPVCGDGVCGFAFGASGPEVCPADCEGVGPDGHVHHGGIDAGVDAGVDGGVDGGGDGSGGVDDPESLPAQ